LQSLDIFLNVRGAAELCCCKISKLRGLLKQHGRISGILIDEAEDLPSSAAFRSRFGSLVTAYKLIGYDPCIDYGFIEVNRRLRREHPMIVAGVIEEMAAIGGKAVWDDEKEVASG